MLAKQVNVKPLKQRDFTKCVCCERGVLHNRSVTFYKLQVSQFIVDMQAVQRLHALEQMFAPATFLAGVMGPDEDMAKPVGPAVEILLCDTCASEYCVMSVFESAGESLA